MIRLVFIDIDGTLLDSNRNVTENTKKEISRCLKRNIKIVLTSGRSRFETINYQREINSSPYVISSNGADVYDIATEKEIYTNPIPKEIVKELLKYIQDNDCKIRFNYDSEMAINKAFYEDEKNLIKTIDELICIANTRKIVQCMIADKKIEKVMMFKEYLKRCIPSVKIENESKRLMNLELKPSGNYFCDITTSNVTKGKSVRELCKYLKINEEEIAVIGDGNNDISMFEITPNSVAMGNASLIVKEKANYITDTNDEEGVANFLKKI